MKSIIAHHFLDFAKRDFTVVVAEDLRKAVRVGGKRLGVEFVLTDADYDAQALAISYGAANYLLAFRFDQLSANLICHEVTHATNGMFARIGIQLNKGSDEAFAYHNDMLFRNVAELLAQHHLTIPLLPS